MLLFNLHCSYCVWSHSLFSGFRPTLTQLYFPWSTNVKICKLSSWKWCLLVQVLINSGAWRVYNSVKNKVVVGVCLFFKEIRGNWKVSLLSSTAIKVKSHYTNNSRWRDLRKLATKSLLTSCFLSSTRPASSKCHRQLPLTEKLLTDFVMEFKLRN